MQSEGAFLKCYRCGRKKGREGFAWRRKHKGQRDSLCRPCRSAYGKEHYAANRQRYIDQAEVVKARLRLERMTYLIEYFAWRPCVDCGERDPIVLEFDHVREKRFDIGRSLTSQTWQSMLEEIERCEVVCSNCHRRRTAWRRGSLRVRLTEPSEAGDRA